MKSTFSILVAIFVCLAFEQVLAAAVPADNFSRYDVILTRKPFGEPPPDAAQALNAAAAAQSSFIKNLKLVAITEDAEGNTKVGFVDVAANKSYYLPVGPSDDGDGIEVLDADYDSGSALLKKGADQQWISMNTDAGAGGQPGVAMPRSGGNAGIGFSGRRESYAERAKRRREAIRHRVVEPPKLSDAEMEKHLKEYQMNLIRAGGEDGPPLPMQLTKEMDDQLVAEGVLPPADQSGGGEEAPVPAPEEQ